MPAPSPNPIKTNPLGQFADEALDAGKSIATDVAKGVAEAVDPKKILESILGSSASPNQKSENPGIEDLSGGQQAMDPAQQALLQQQRIQQKMAEDQKKSEALIRLHRQRLQEEEEFFQRTKQQEDMQKQQEEQNDQVKKQNEVVQLQHEKQKENVLGSMIKQYEGSKEQKAWGAG